MIQEIFEVVRVVLFSVAGALVVVGLVALTFEGLRDD